MEKSQHRHDISDKAWAILEPMLPGQRGQWGGIAEDNRRFINGVFWILRTGAPWRDLPPDYGKWGSVHQRFRRWRDKGIWEKILEALIDDPDYEWLMIDASHCKVHPHAAGAKGGNQDMSRTKGGSTPRFTLPWIRLVCRSELLSQKAHRADCKEAVHLIEGIDAQNLLADRGYDTSEIVAFALSAGINVIIPPKKNRKEQREYDRYLYKIRHLVENAFLWLKRWRGIATRYAKNSSSFLSAVHIRCIAIWLAVLA